MADTMTPAQRSALMSRIRSKDTKPELIVRSVLHRLGYRFRLHDPTLPGKPDIVLRRHAKAILVHGCFWHRHGECRKLTMPKTNRAFWAKKFRANLRRDRAKLAALGDAGWTVLVVWECETRDRVALAKTLAKFMKARRTGTPRRRELS